MAIGLLLLRIVLGAMIIGHGCQKARGWFRGAGLVATADLFARWGFRPGRPMAMLAATCEISGGVLVLAGLATPLASAMLIGTLIVASAANVRNGLWAAQGGFELAFLYASMALVLAVAGPGRWSLDYAVGLGHRTWWGALALGVGIVGSVPPLIRRRIALAVSTEATRPEPEHPIARR